MEAQNISIFKPWKDMCNIYVSQSEKHFWWRMGCPCGIEGCSKGLESRKDVNKNFVYVMDLETILVCPHSRASAIYYRTKVQVHNFTLYDLKSNNGYCSIWEETEGGVTANEFTTISCDFIDQCRSEKMMRWSSIVMDVVIKIAIVLSLTAFTI